MEIVAKPSLGVTIAGLYTFFEHAKSNGYPIYKHDDYKNLCLFKWNGWKVDNCFLKQSDSTVGLIRARVSPFYPQDTGPKWSYYNSKDTLDPAIVVKCA